MVTREELNAEFTALYTEAQRIADAAWDSVRESDWCKSVLGNKDTCASLRRWSGQVEAYVVDLKLELYRLKGVPDEELSDADVERVRGMAEVITNGARQILDEARVNLWARFVQRCVATFVEFLKKVVVTVVDVVGEAGGAAVGGLLNGLGLEGLALVAGVLWIIYGDHG